MTPDNQSEEELRRMLNLKRLEQPPTRFFQSFSEKIIDRLHKPEAVPNPTWWQRMGLDIDAKPVLVCVAGVAVCALLVYGLISSAHVDPPPPPAGDSAQNLPLPVSPVGGQMAKPAPVAARIARPEELPRSVDPALAPEPSAPNRFIVRPKPVGYNADPGGR